MLALWFVNIRLVTNHPASLFCSLLVANLGIVFFTSFAALLVSASDMHFNPSFLCSRSVWLMLLQPHHWQCVGCVIHHGQNVRKEQHHISVAQTSNNRVISSGELYCCLLPQCEALRTCRSGFSDRNNVQNTTKLWNGRLLTKPV